MSFDFMVSRSEPSRDRERLACSTASMMSSTGSSIDMVFRVLGRRTISCAMLTVFPEPGMPPMAMAPPMLRIARSNCAIWDGR
ncbi:hypothetical protein D3C87_1506340 [compost metagenome]